MGSWIKGLARTGYAARGLVYVLIGFFAVLAAFGRSEVEGTEGALQALLRQPFGTILVWFVAIGLAAFCVWRGVQAIRDTDNHGSEAKGIAIRAGLALGGLSYAVVALLAAAIATGSRSGSEEGGGGDPTGGWLAAIHEIGLGWLVVYGVAAILFAVGAAHIVKGLRAGFEKYFRCTEDVMAWLRPLARFGLIARGIVFLIVGGLVVRGGLAYDVEERPGLADALQAVRGHDFGWLILLAIALGLVAFGLYSLAEARYRTVSPD